jgi:hypothetical protein
MGRTNAIERGNTKLALVSPAATKNDVALF